MQTGTVKFFDPKKGYGFIVPDDGADDVFVHASAISTPGYRYLAEEEPVEFEVKAGENGRPQAINVHPQSGRLQGVIESFDQDRGFGTIVDSNNGTEYFLHFSDILGYGATSKTAFPEDKVQFEPGTHKGRPAAKRVKRLDPRPPLFSFANMGQDRNWLESVSNLAEDENWDYRNLHPQTEHEGEDFKPILKSYITYTFARLRQEDKIAYDNEDSPGHACFNTGLVTDLQEEIFAVFVRNRREQEDGCRWRLEGFYRASDKKLLSTFSKLPELANYFDEPSVLLYDRRCELHIDVDHVLKDNLHRFPESLHENEYLARQLLESARRSTEKRVYRNYKTAIPQFYRNGIQLLLPLCLEKPNRADLALVVERIGEAYRGTTVLPLDMAYNNARLITRPDSDWLKP